MATDKTLWRTVAMVAVGIWLIVVIAALKAEAHTAAELDEWRVDWVKRADLSLTDALFDEWDDMEARHPWYYNPQDAPGGSEATIGRTTAVNWNTSAGVEQWRSLVMVYFPANEVERALCIMDHESKGNPNALNTRGSSAAGLFQFLRSTWGRVPLSVSGGSYDSGQVYQAKPNIASAAWLLEHETRETKSGWTQWSPYNSGECR